jgi:hypothetical protein
MATALPILELRPDADGLPESVWAPRWCRRPWR